MILSVLCYMTGITEETGQEILGEMISIRQMFEKLLKNGLPGTIAAAAHDPALEGAKHNCPSCGGPMALRNNRTDGTKFFGCRSYPNCRGVRDINGINGRPNDPAPYDTPRAGPVPVPQPRPAPTPAPSGGREFDDWQEDDDIPF